eukprot:TRINITY_DN1523_c0_g3_i7.p1 TRINITY_DN1523_c0_g3~~TRINITY_DN1523_c0_g3_i7.p1  ORF type:complete len:275 (-),score=90.89 TRINITY_DN1523_c0_g3_i7:53-877(-)
MNLDDFVNKELAKKGKGSSKPKVSTKKDSKSSSKAAKRLPRDPQDNPPGEEIKAKAENEDGMKVLKTKPFRNRKTVKLAEGPKAHPIRNLTNQEAEDSRRDRESAHNVPAVPEQERGAAETPEDSKATSSGMNIRPVKLKHKLKTNEASSKEDTKAEDESNQDAPKERPKKPAFDSSKLKFVRKKKEYKHKEDQAPANLSNLKGAESESFPMKPSSYKNHVKSSQEKEEALAQAILKSQQAEKKEDDEYKDDFEDEDVINPCTCLLYTSPSPRD